MRTSATALLSLLALLLLPAAASAACPGEHLVPNALNVAKVRSAVLCLHNEARAGAGLAPLRENAKLRLAAARHSTHMTLADFFDHVSPSGTTLLDRVKAARYITRRSRSWVIGENIGWGSREAGSAGSIFQSWMNSDGHRRNVLDGRFTKVGIGIALGSPAGPGGGATYTVDFG